MSSITTPRPACSRSTSVARPGYSPVPRPAVLVQAGVLAFGLLCWGGCGGASPSAQTAFTEADAKLFDDGMDLIASGQSLQGRWQEEWYEELRSRTASADAIAVVHVRTLRTDTDPQKRVTHRIIVSPQRVLHGDLDQDEVELPSREDSHGFRTVDGRIGRLEQGAFLAFLKWYKNEGGVGVHWHLSPASEEVVAATAKLLGGGEVEGPQVIVHEQAE